MVMGRSLVNIISASPEETIVAGERIARLLHGGSVVALRGGLGSGKTYLTKGIARGLGITEEITSPTFTIISEYQGELPFYHIAAYRLGGDDDFIALGGEDLLYGQGIAVIEWSERLPGTVPDNALIVEIEITGENRRVIRITAPGADYG
ncbi:MAG: tRNA (adenosine(37)-N6)-threonylcarbamoyltransferase complex ATPase subunit type 1 TsaE [Treponema sp.]|jgi:tRNA threonylcarbamoyladenosine biosynthesis protein TsaE|nr:tRNA (adenosine(37)-N6)-threonylcarbamoyltransferase complex ATPase subunit type 1 TsaE [Treponema sp.]